MDVLYTIISLISGAVGGNIAGSSMPQKNLGPLVNSIVGLIGGGFGEFLLKVLGVLSTGDATGVAEAAGSGFDISSLLASIGAGGVSGGVLTAIVALIKDAIQKK